jgi:alpha-methylacyl-CoA racemase
VEVLIMSLGPLAGIRVLELTGLGPAPYACLLLAELGADVLRIERPDGERALTDGLHRSRPSLAVDLGSEEGRERVLSLVERADVLVEGFRPGVTERLGIGPDACRERNQALIYARMTGWGQQGPLAATAGHDITYLALTGALHATGPAGKPVQAMNLVADMGGGSLFLIVGILAALVERQRSGLGQIVDAAMVDGASSLMTMVYGLYGRGLWQDARESNLIDGGVPWYDTYECADGKFVAVGPLEPRFYAELVRGLNVTGTVAGSEVDYLQAQRHPEVWPALRTAFAAAFASRTRDEWVAAFEGTDACVAPVLSLAEAPEHPHLAARGVFSTVDGHTVPAVAPKFSRTPGRPPTPAGPADERILRQWGLA